MSLANRRHYVNERSIVCGLFNAVNLYGEYSFPLSNFRKPFVSDQKFLLTLHFCFEANKVQFCSKVPHFHIQFPTFSGVIPPNPHCRRGRWLSAVSGDQRPRSSSPQFDPHFQIRSAVYGAVVVTCLIVVREISESKSTITSWMFTNRIYCFGICGTGCSS